MAKQPKQGDASILRSEEIDEIIGRPPHWLIQWGITMFFTILVLIFGLSYFIKYPEMVTATFTIMPENPPIPISVNENGTLIKMSVKVGSFVNKNDTLFYWQKNGGANKMLMTMAPSGGRIDITSPIINQKKIIKGEILLYVIPPSIYDVVLYIKSRDIRKIVIGQKVIVNIRLPASQGHQALNGVVNYISSINTPKGYFVKVSLPGKEGFDKNDILRYGNDLSGTAEIIINKRRLIDKFIAKTPVKFN